jgi:hypothetical protein
VLVAFFLPTVKIVSLFKSFTFLSKKIRQFDIIKRGMTLHLTKADEIN